ncbi:hypothetical protein FHR83_006783 [Actinoplanes campanulatus]|uniref:Uncharacterized protein n=1 Tax=Actinoplanes campanulatus TaxID=113559 RepID=A0A7W5AML4_9ACTN|nr:hypothetical protein [Actinoplanes campanulatus]MBB3099077.1 hypothetical protein [Actinoplanes campanulatus]GGN39146.1 hypothetical protein GCM10010109_66750 [Actinoplanes campanulatus]GID40234.1 hypothetical protein Aca09nite_67400 [Actinoplanes campanulatus]
MTAVPFAVEWVFLDESTPRQIHTSTVTAVDADDARMTLLGSIPEDRVSVLRVSAEEDQQ